MPGVDYVEVVQLNDFDEQRKKFNQQSEMIGISLEENELVEVEIDKIITIQQHFEAKWKRNN